MHLEDSRRTQFSIGTPVIENASNSLKIKVGTPAQSTLQPRFSIRRFAPKNDSFTKGRE